MHFIQVFSSTKDLPFLDWVSVLNDRDVFLSPQYLQSLYSTLNKSISFYYAIAYNENKQADLITVFQVLPFVFLKKNQPQTIVSNLKRDKAGRYSSLILVCGNVFAAGEHGFLTSERIDKKSTMHLLKKCTSMVIEKHEKEHSDKNISGILFKEFFQLDTTKSILEKKGFHSFEIDVNMVLPISKNWKSMDDYLASFKAKYRTKANSVFKKSEGLEIRNLTAIEITTYKKDITVLFDNVLSKSPYRFGRMTTECFVSLKENLKEKFCFKAIFDNNQMVGFSSSFLNGTVLEANYVGFDYEANTYKSVYQCLLYDYVLQAITSEVEQLEFGRTSELLKSSLGAVPIPMFLYAKHQSKLKNFVLGNVLKKVSASPYEIRKPFKAEHYLM